MAKCKQCNEDKGIFELKDGICKSCIKLENPECPECRKTFKKDKLINGICEGCTSEIDKKRKSKQLESLAKHEIENIMLTTETSINLEILERLEIITSECVLGMDVFKDILAGFKDIFGGRSKTTQEALKKAKEIVLEELKKEAYVLGANAVIAVDLDYSEFSGGGKSMLFIVASGTAVKIKK